MLNGSPLTREGLFKIRNYTIPDTGTLRLDYVTYKVRGGSDWLTKERVGMAGWSAALRAALPVQLYVGMGWQAQGALHTAVQVSLCGDAVDSLPVTTHEWHASGCYGPLFLTSQTSSEASHLHLLANLIIVTQAIMDWPWSLLLSPCLYAAQSYAIA